MKWICLECLTEHNHDGVTEMRQYPIKDRVVTVATKHAYCPCCHAEMCSDEATDHNLAKAYDQYKKEENLLTPDDIRAIREKYKISQSGFAKILGLGEKTITRYENGALQDVGYNSLLVLCKDVNNFNQLFQKRKHLLKAAEARQIQEVINALLKPKRDYYARIDYTPDSRFAAYRLPNRQPYSSPYRLAPKS